MKVYYIGSKYMGCNYVRTLLPMWHNGWSGDVDSLYRGRKKPDLVMKEILDSDVVVFHRADTVEHHKVALACKQAGKKLVFDNDDTFKHIEDNGIFKRVAKHHYKQKWKEVDTLIDNFIRNMDIITTTTEFLAEEYRKINDDVVVLPNYVDPLDWEEPKRNEGDRVRIGIVGSVAYYNDAEVIEDYLVELSNRKDVTLVLFGLQDKKFRSENKLVEAIYKKDYELWNKVGDIEHVGAVPMHEYFETLNNLKLDLMLIPRKDNYFNRCKSNIKFLEAGMCEIPVVAQTWGDGQSPYDPDIDGKNGLLAKSTDDWKDMTEKLIQDKEYRRNMGKLAKEYVLTNYNIENNYLKWHDAYKKICEK
jgi:O-antigen biosynthesis protein